MNTEGIFESVGVHTEVAVVPFNGYFECHNINCLLAVVVVVQHAKVLPFVLW